MPQGFVTKCFLIFIVDEVKKFSANNIHSSCWSQSHIGIRAKGLVTVWRFVHQGKKKATRRLSPIGYWSKGSTIVWYFRIGKSSGKILYTCNRLIVDQWILGSGDLKITQWSFCLARGFSHLSINHHINLISTTFSLLSDLLGPSRFACNLT